MTGPRGALARLLATLFGAGRSPVAPGTVASIAAAAPLLAPLRGPAYAITVAALAAAAYVASVAVARELFRDRVDAEDPPWFVLDEACGLWIATWRPAGISPPSLLFAFVAFRVLDIVKPFPIGRLQCAGGGHGIVLDDAAAGLVALAAGLALEAWLA